MQSRKIKTVEMCVAVVHRTFKNNYNIIGATLLEMFVLSFDEKNLLRTITSAYFCLFLSYSYMMECVCHSMLTKWELVSLCTNQQWAPVIPYGPSVDLFL